MNWEAEKEEVEWEQKAMANWLKFGDQHLFSPQLHKSTKAQEFDEET